MDIDLVYLWCDGSQPKMLEKRLKAERELGIVRDESVNGKCRYVSTDELRFSLRSVELHAPWIRRIFIVVDDDQILPGWLKAEGTKITIVRHSEIMPPKMMPIFNSLAISFRIPFIKGLSECFLYANDDMMIFRDVSPEYFFTAEGHPIVYHFEARNKDGEKTQYHRLLINCEHAVTEALGVNEELSRVIGRWPHHNIQGFCKSHLLECHKLFHKQIETTCHSRFRADDNLEEWLFSCYALAIGEGEARLARDLAGEHGPAFSSSLMFNRREHWGQFEERIKTYNPYLFCVNDNDQIRDEDRLRMKDCLRKVFAMKNEPLRVLIAANSGANRITANTFVATLAEALRVAGALVDCGTDLFWNAELGAYDIVHLQWPEALIGWNSAKATEEFLQRLRYRLVELKAAGAKIVYTRHNRKPHKISGENINKLTEIFETEADAIVHMGETSKRECLEANPNSTVRHVVIPHHLKDEIEFTISREESRAKLGIAADAKVMLAFGAFRHEEEVALVNDAVKGLDIPNFKLLAPLCPGDTYKGLVPDDELPAYFAAADIVFLQRVKVLNSGVLPLAYDAARVCVGPSDGNAGEILAATGNPTFDPSDHASVVDAIKNGFALAAEGKGEANRAYAREKWSPDQVAKMTLAFYQDLLAGRQVELARHRNNSEYTSSLNTEFWNPSCCCDVIRVHCPRALLTKTGKLSFFDLVRVRNRLYEHQIRGRKLVYIKHEEASPGNADAVVNELHRLFEEESDLVVHAGDPIPDSFIPKRCRVLKVAFKDIGNMGDQLNRLIIRKVFGYEVLSVPASEAVMSGIGSHLGGTVAGKNHDYPISVWGTGLGSRVGFWVSSDRSFDVRAVRGELSRQRLEAALGRKLEIPTGDGGLLSPFLLDSPVEKKYKLGIIPHFRDRDNPIFKKLESLTDNFLRIDLTDDPLSVVKQIASCETIITNSLHGLIVSDAFGIPNLHVKITSMMLGDGFKFEDYYSSYGMKDEFLDLERDNVPSLDFVRSHYKVPRKLVLQKQQELIASFPFPIRESIEDKSAVGELARFLSNERHLISLAMSNSKNTDLDEAGILREERDRLLAERQTDKAKIDELRNWIAGLKMMRDKLSTEKAAANKKIEDLRKWIASLVATRENLQKVLENLRKEGV